MDLHINKKVLLRTRRKKRAEGDGLFNKSSPENRIEIFTDGNDDYAYILPEYYAKYGLCSVDKDQRVKGEESDL